MKHRLFLYTGLLGALLSVGAGQLYAGDVGSTNTDTVIAAATPGRAALHKLFHTPQYSVIDPVDQFALDWNGFTPLGTIVTHEMRPAKERAAASNPKT